MKSRFNNFFDNPDGDILKHAHRIKIDVMADDDGVCMSFEIHGSVWPDEDESEGGGTCQQEKPDAAELADDLLRKFVLAKGGGK